MIIAEKENPIGTSIDPKTLDFEYLRQQGIQHIERLAGKVWTDYNTHDPGITILEYLCFGLQDLNYRSTLPIEDITHDPGYELPSPGEALKGSAVTIHDLRKVALDVEGVKNAWALPASKLEKENIQVKGRYMVLLEMENDATLGDLDENHIFRQIDEERSIEIELPSWDKDVKVDWSDPADIIDHIQKILVWKDENVLTYDTWKEVPATYREMAPAQDENEDSMFTQYGDKVKKCREIRDRAYKKLQAHRNLCEDFACIKGVKIEEIGFTAGIDVAGEASMQDVLEEIFYRVSRFISPPVTFKKARDLLQKGVPVEKIFLGPALTHGILLDDDLPSHRQAIYVSDIIHLIMDCPGVKAVKRFEMANYLGGTVHTEGNRWCVPLSPDRQYLPRLSPRKCNIVFYKDGFPFTLPMEPVMTKYEKRIATHRKWAPGHDNANALPYPASRARSLSNYFTLQNDFPRNYGIGEEGLSLQASPLRKAQANQLKGYLVIFEQLMANFLSQLSHGKKLLRIGDDGEQTLFYQLLDDIPNIGGIYDPTVIASQMAEKTEERYRRKNDFLNHLLARLGMNVEEYLLLTTGTKGDKHARSKLKDKQQLVGKCLTLNAYRSSAYDYSQPVTWDTGNVSGYKKRLCILLGIANYKRKSLHDVTADRVNEGFHLVEHILLAPRPLHDERGERLPLHSLRLQQEKPCKAEPLENDPYSFKVTMVLPVWVGRFTSPSFRAYFERMAQIEGPAHIEIRCFWLGEPEMKEFEKAYKPWVQALPTASSTLSRFYKKRNALVAQLNELYGSMKPMAPDNPIENREKYSLLSNHPDWSIPSIDHVEDEHWLIHPGNIIIQNGYAGCNAPTHTGLGTVALYRHPLADDFEALEMTMTLDTHEYSEAGLVFSWRSGRDYWLFNYRNYHKKVTVAHVKEGKVTIVMENPTRSLHGKQVTLRISRHNGKIRFQQTSPGVLGSEFLLNISSETLSKTQFGLFTRFSNYTRFHRLERVDRKADLIVPVKHIGSNEIHA